MWEANMQQKGFTLIELMVSVTIFIIVMTISLGALLAMSEADRKAEGIKSVMNNLNFALESMARTIRTGFGYGCNGSTGTDCINGAGGYRLSLTAANGNDVTYCLGSAGSCLVSTSCTAGSTCTILRSIEGGTFSSLTAPEVNIENLSFFVQGSPPGNAVQARVIITLNGTVTLSGQVTDFRLQTSVTQRLYDQ